MTRKTEILDHWSDKHMFCGDFAEDYKSENPNAVLKVGLHDGNDDVHCFVYDPDLDATFDATQRQFEIHNPCEFVDEWYIGDNHPHMSDVQSFDTVEAFRKARREANGC